MNPDCIGNQGAYIFDSKLPQCDKCGNGPPNIATVVVMHYAYYNPKGHMKGYQGRKIAIACGSRVPVSPYNCHTDNIDIVNCPACYKSEIFKKVWSPMPDNLLSYYNDPNLSEEDRTKYRSQLGQQ